MKIISWKWSGILFVLLIISIIGIETMLKLDNEIILMIPVFSFLIMFILLYIVTGFLIADLLKWSRLSILIMPFIFPFMIMILLISIGKIKGKIKGH